MRYAEFLPAPDAGVFAERYWCLEGAGGGGGPILPDGHPELVLHLGDRPSHLGVRQKASLFVAQMRTATTVAMQGEMSAWGIRLRPHMGRAIAGGLDQSRLAGSIHDAEGICGASVRGLREALGNACDSAARVRITDAWLRARAEKPGSPVAGAALGLLPRLSVELTAARLGCTRRHLERVFGAEVGLSPRAWARIARMQSALRVRDSNPGWTWADVAAEAGYADQPHLALDFRQIAGTAPSRLLPGILSHSSKPDAAHSH
ncbi:MAG: helix-turn-helix transcriptional regulator [Bryobacteraceae bacterium]|nr:helix-turn-helix transcriptional regulator [Bryobacteraceae bacterium]